MKKKNVLISFVALFLAISMALGCADLSFVSRADDDWGGDGETGSGVVVDDDDDDDYWDDYDNDYDYAIDESYQYTSPVSINSIADIKLGEKEAIGDYYTYDAFVSQGSTGSLDIYGGERSFWEQYVPRLKTRVIASENTEILQITESGGRYYYTAVGVGVATVRVECEVVYSATYTSEKYKYYSIKVSPNMDNITTDVTSFNVLCDVSPYRWDSNAPTVSAKLLGVPEGYSFDSYNSDFSYKVSGSKISANVYMENNVISIDGWGKGTTTVSVFINGKQFDFSYTIEGVSINKTTITIMTGKTKQLKLKGAKGSVKWKSGNKKVATVTGKGKVKGKKLGSALVTATYRKTKFYCIVNVATKAKYNAIKTAKKIASTSTYSQPKRMQNGFYDCSSLVWRSYSKYGVYLGNRNWAPTAADIAKYLCGQKKKVGKASNKNFQKRKFAPGDLFFETGAANGRFKGIYHVEMFVGYDIGHVDDKGKPYYDSMWANRGNGFAQGADSCFLCRP